MWLAKCEKIDQVIQTGLSKLRDSSGLTEALEQIGTSLHYTILLPKQHQGEVLRQFLEDYITELPLSFRAFEGVGEKTGIGIYVDMFVNLAMELFLSDEHGVRVSDVDETALDQWWVLLGKSYLAHRVLEELNDRCCHYWGRPLTPIDMAQSNLLVHSVLGEQSANDLDDVLNKAVDCLRRQEQVCRQTLQPEPIEVLRKALEEWPCLLQDQQTKLGLALRLSRSLQ